MLKSIFRHSTRQYHSFINKLNTSPYNGLTGSQAVFNKLIEHEVEHAFVYSGGAIMPLIDKFKDSKINYYINTHEQSAGHAATGYAKSTGKPGILIVTSGPGLTNVVTPITDATNDSTPLIVLSGQVPLKAMGTNAFQECPSVEITTPITKWSYCVKDVNEIPEVIDEAFRISTSGKPGAVHIDLPKCVANEIIISLPDHQNKNIIPKEIIDDKLFIETGSLIDKAKNPVILIGQGCNTSAELLRKFAYKTNIPVTSTIHAMGTFDELHPLSLEFLGMHGNIAANYAIQNADLIIALGTRFDDRITGAIEYYAPDAYNAYELNQGGIIHVNINEDEINSVVDSHYNFNMRCETFLNKIMNCVTPQRRDRWIDLVNSWKKHYPFKYDELELEMNTQMVMNELNNQLIEKDISNYYITSGVGNHQMMASQFIKWRYPGTFISSGSLGVMGSGLPYAIGCQIGNPESMIIDLDGDGSFNHTLSELKTVKEYNLPLKIAVFNDRSMSMVRAWEELFFEGRITATDNNNNPDYENLAMNFGIMSLSCDNKLDLPDIMDEFLNYPEAILCEFKVESDLCLPLVAPGAALDDIIIGKENIRKSINTALPPN